QWKDASRKWLGLSGMNHLVDASARYRTLQQSCDTVGPIGGKTVQKLVTIVFVLWTCPGSWAQSGDAIRVAMFALGNTPHLDAVTSACSDELAAVSRVKVVDASVPGSYEYLFLLATNESESAVAISAHVSERIEHGLLDRFYIKANKENIRA